MSKSKSYSMSPASSAVDRRRKPPIPVSAVGSPVAVDALAILILRRLNARERPALTLVVNEQPSRPLPEIVEG